VSAHLYIEGGESKDDQIRCREGFRKLFEKAGFTKRMPRLTASGGRQNAFEDFHTAHAMAHRGHFVAMLIDSEGPTADAEKTWHHLKTRDNWTQPASTTDDQVLFITTCMETWIVADRAALKRHYGSNLQENALPPMFNLEKRDRHQVHGELAHATRNCSNCYAKGKRSFKVLEMLDPAALSSLTSFARTVRILDQKLGQSG